METSLYKGHHEEQRSEKKEKSDSAADKKRIKELERELARKDKALAEAAPYCCLEKSSTRFEETTGTINPVTGAYKNSVLDR